MTTTSFLSQMAQVFSPDDVTTVVGLKHRYALSDEEEKQFVQCIERYSIGGFFLLAYETICSCFGKKSLFTQTRAMLACHICKAVQHDMQKGYKGFSMKRFFALGHAEGPSKSAIDYVCLHVADAYADFLLRYMIAEKVYTQNGTHALFSKMKKQAFIEWRRWNKNPEYKGVAISYLPHLVTHTVYRDVCKQGRENEMACVQSACDAFAKFLMQAVPE